MTERETAPPADIVPFWSIVWGQFRRKRLAMAALWCAFGMLVLATVAPLIALNVPYLLVRNGETTWPLFDRLFDRFLFPNGVDLLFNLFLVLAPLWWLAARLIRASGLGGTPVRPRTLVASGLPLVVLAGFYVVWAGGDQSLFGRLLVVGLLGAAAMAAGARVERALGPRERPRVRRVVRSLLLAIFAVTFVLVYHAWETSRSLVDYPREIAALEETGEGWGVLPPIPYHFDNRGEAGERSAERAHSPPSTATRNYLGCDPNGRDVVARILFGTRISLTIGVVAVSIYISIGIVLGSLAGYFGGRVDMLISRLIEIMLCIPTLFLLLTIIALLESRSIFLIMVAIGVVGWTGVARLVRGEFLRQKSLDYVVAAKALGIPERRIIFGHVLKNSLGPVLVSATFGIAAAILTESGISFLGLGDPSAPSWGHLLNVGRETTEMWLILSPGAAIFFVVTIFNLIGEGLRDALDPKLRQ